MLLQEAKRGLGASAVFIARNRFAVLDKASGQIQVSNGNRAGAPCGHEHVYALLSVACTIRWLRLTFEPWGVLVKLCHYSNICSVELSAPV